jgi:diphosphomevalonate decarboxylase
MNLADLETRTSVTFDPKITSDELILNGEHISGEMLNRVRRFLDRVRKISNVELFAKVDSFNTFPMGAGIASSSSAFAALSLAATTAANLTLNEVELSRLARTGSGSASRSVPGGFVEWMAGNMHENSYSVSIAPPEHWDLTDVIVIVNASHKEIGSSRAQLTAGSSPLQTSRIKTVQSRLDMCRQSILEHDFETFTEIVETDCIMMHAVMMTSSPPLYYWEPTTISVIKSVKGMRRQGLPVCFTIDAGPNVHVLCPSNFTRDVVNILSIIPGVLDIIQAKPGGGAFIIP